MPMDYDRNAGRTTWYCATCHQWVFEMCAPDTCPNNRPPEDTDDQDS